jgi:hypothetical protein
MAIVFYEQQIHLLRDKSMPGRMVPRGFDQNQYKEHDWQNRHIVENQPNDLAEYHFNR